MPGSPSGRRQRSKDLRVRGCARERVATKTIADITNSLRKQHIYEDLSIRKCHLPTVRPGAGIKGGPAEERENRRGRSNSLAQVLNSGAPVETDKAVGGIDDCAGAAREHGWYGRRWRSWRTNSFPSRVSYTISPCALCRQTPKVGAECPNWARWDLCGGPVMSVPAANTSGSALGGIRSLIVTQQRPSN